MSKTYSQIASQAASSRGNLCLISPATVFERGWADADFYQEELESVLFHDSQNGSISDFLDLYERQVLVIFMTFPHRGLLAI